MTAAPWTDVRTDATAWGLRSGRVAVTRCGHDAMTPWRDVAPQRERDQRRAEGERAAAGGNTEQARGASGEKSPSTRRPSSRKPIGCFCPLPTAPRPAPKRSTTCGSAPSRVSAGLQHHLDEVRSGTDGALGRHDLVDGAEPWALGDDDPEPLEQWLGNGASSRWISWQSSAHCARRTRTEGLAGTAAILRGGVAPAAHAAPLPFLRSWPA